MTPRRLLPYLLIFLALVGSYAALQWDRAQREALDLEAKKVFQVKEGEISELALIKGKDEIRLVKQGQEWTLSKPLKARAYQEAIGFMLTTLAYLGKERDLGTGQDLKAFGLDKPQLIVAFTAAGKEHRLLVGAKAPGDRSYYALKDQEPRLMLVNAADKDSLDRSLLALRDRNLFTFTLDKVKGLKLRIGKTIVSLEKAGPQTWRQVGRESFPVRGDQVEAFLRHLHFAKVKEFAAENPLELRPYGLVPQPPYEVTVILETGPETLLLGGKATGGIFARKGAAGPVVVVDQDLPGQITKTVASLEDRRLWAGPLGEVQKVVWGPPEKTWVAVKDKDFWKLTGPEGRELRQPAVRLDMALGKLTGLEYQRLLPGTTAPAPRPIYLVAVYDGAGKQLFHLKETGRKGEAGVEVRSYLGDKATSALMPRKDYTAWQEEMERLTATAAKD